MAPNGTVAKKNGAPAQGPDKDPADDRAQAQTDCLRRGKDPHRSGPPRWPGGGNEHGDAVGTEQGAGNPLQDAKQNE
jgi:hypothetical protein